MSETDGQQPNEEDDMALAEFVRKLFGGTTRSADGQEDEDA